MERESQNRKLTTDVSSSTARVSSSTTVVCESRALRHTVSPRASRRFVSLAPRRFASLALILVCLAVFAFTSLRGSNAKATPSPASASAAAVAQGSTRFSHSVAKHAEVACDSCHQRGGGDVQPRLPGHKACTDCHITEFTTPQSPLCLNCHTNVESNNPPLKAFPGLTDFGMRFDHARHMSGSAKPEKGCASCHLPARRGAGLSIPAGFAAHENCYQCHTPGAQSGGRSISTCSLCHAQGSYSRPSTSSRAYSVSFSHATHGARQGLSCEECHQVRAGAPQTRQVASPQPTQHFGTGRAQNCMTCHNNRRAFGGDDFADCKRCHTGQTFRF